MKSLLPKYRRTGRSFVLPALAALILTAAPAAFAAATIDGEFRVSPGDKLDLDLEAGGDVEVIGWGRNTVRIEGGVRGRDADNVEVGAEKTSSGVRLWTRFQRHAREQRSRMEFTIHVPDRFDLELDSMGGGLHMENVEGTFRGETMGGGLFFDGIRGRVDITTMGGAITLRDSEVDGRLKTMGGTVLFENVVGDVDGSSMGGNVILKNVTRSDGASTGGRVVISTMGGRVDVDEAPEGAEVDTMGGDVHVLSARRFVKAKTMGGDVSIDEVDGWVKATTMAGDIDVVVIGDGGSGRGDVELRSYSGDVELTVPEGYDMEIDIELAFTKNETRRYRIESDFPLHQETTDDWDYGQGSPRKYISGTGTIGSGTHRIRIRTVNGNVYLKKGR